MPIAAGANRNNVVYVGSLANVLAPGISMGFIVAPSLVFGHLANLRAASDARSDAAVECAVAELFEDGELLRHVLRMRRIYASRRDCLAAALKHHLGDASHVQGARRGHGNLGTRGSGYRLEAVVA